MEQHSENREYITRHIPHCLCLYCVCVCGPIVTTEYQPLYLYRIALHTAFSRVLAGIILRIVHTSNVGVSVRIFMRFLTKYVCHISHRWRSCYPNSVANFHHISTRKHSAIANTSDNTHTHSGRCAFACSWLFSQHATMRVQNIEYPKIRFCFGRHWHAFDYPKCIGRILDLIRLWELRALNHELGAVFGGNEDCNRNTERGNRVCKICGRSGVRFI